GVSEWLQAYVGRVASTGASGGTPGHEATDVLRDVTLSWEPVPTAVKRDVYFGASFEDVNTATDPMAAGLTAASYDVGVLDFGTTYYWRVDEVNGAPDNTVFRGDVWNFEVEPYSIEIPGSTIAVTASSSSNESSMPEKTVDGSGLDPNTGTHAMDPAAMWFTATVDLDPWIQYEFDGVKKLDVMTVWNANSSAESAIGWGVKDVQIQYSVDGENWEALADPTQFSRAPGLPTYDAYDEVALGGVAAKMVRLNIQSNWGGILMSYGLSEVKFSMIPVQARTPEPASNAAAIIPNSVVTWRAGREAVKHTLYLGMDMNAVAEGLAPSVTSMTNTVDLGSLALELGKTYYWRVDEVNQAEAVAAWAGPVWAFSTVDALTVDDFEGYNNLSPDRPFQTWLDGFGYSSDEFFPTEYPGNGTGAGTGHDIWSLSSPQYDGDIMETTRTIAGSGQSMPFYYTNTGGVVS
ncbi:MAG: discoidin domain-containing protein, partial [Planctomycetes bacterium]|nr:discoidin domain-containing protein [Planctomycetota bacterium]